MKYHFTLLLLSSAFITCAQVPNYIDTTGLVAYYAFDTNATDGYIHHNNGAITGNLTPTTDRFSNPIGAYFFDGISSFITVQPSPSISNFPNGQSICMWMKIDTLPTDQREHYIVWKEDNNDYTFYHLFLTNFANSNQILYRFGDDNATGYGIAPYDSIPVGQWFYYSVITDLSHTYSYINGGLVGDSMNNQGGYFTPNNDPLYIGTNYDSDPNKAKFRGSVDDMTIYNRALNQCDVLKQYYQSFFTKNPLNDTVNVGDAALFCVADTTGPWNYQWQGNYGVGWIDLTNGSMYNGVNTDTLHLSNVIQTMNGYEYRCVLTGACSDTSTKAELIVNTPNGIINISASDDIYPNPSNNYIQLKNSDSRIMVVENIYGEVINGKFGQKIYVGDVPAGVYLLKVKTSSGIIMEKIEVIH